MSNGTLLHGVAEGSVPHRGAQQVDLDEATRVFPHSGEVVHAVADIKLSGRAADFVLRRLHRTQVSFVGAFGSGWMHSYEQRIWLDGSGGIEHLDGSTGRFDAYPSTGGAGPLDCAAPGVYRKARQLATGEWEVRDASGAICRFHAVDGSAAEGRLASISDSFGNTQVLRYNSAGQLTTVELDQYDPSSASTRRVDFGYQGALLTSVTDVHGGRTWSYGYDANGRLETVTTPAVPTFDGTTTSSASRVTRYGYVPETSPAEEVGNLFTITYAGQVQDRIQLSYDGLDHVDRAYVGEDPSGGSSRPFYDFGYAGVIGGGPVAHYAGVTNRRGHTSTYWIRPDGRTMAITDPLGYSTYFEYNLHGEVTRVEYPEGNSVVSTYRAPATTDRFQHGNVISERRAPAIGKPGASTTNVTHRRYEPIYNTELSTQTRGGEWIFDYEEDPANVAALVADWGIDTPTIVPRGDVNGDGRTDQVGGAVLEIRSNVVTVGVPTGASGPWQAIETWTYDDHGRALSMADPEGALTRYLYADGALVVLGVDVDPDPSACPNTAGAFPNAGTARWDKPCTIAHVDAVTTFARDARGNIVSMTDPRGVVSTFDYNLLDEITGVTLGSGVDATRADPHLAALYAAGYSHLVSPGVEEHFDRGPTGEIVRLRIDNRGAGDAGAPWTIVRCEYDLEDRLTEIAVALSGSSEATSVLEYDAQGNLWRETGPDGAVTSNVYDELDRLQEVRRGAAPDGSVLATTSVTTFEHDTNGNVVAQVEPEDHDGAQGRDRTLFEYDGRDRLYSRTSPTGTQYLFAYESRGYGTNTSVRGRTGGPSSTNNITAGNVLLSMTGMERDEVGRVHVERYHRFDFGQEPGAAAREVHYARDRAGRVVERTDDASSTVSVVRDGMGRSVEETDQLGNVTRRKYDAGGNVVLLQVDAVDPAGGPPVTRSTYLTYDGLNRLIRSVTGGEVSYYAHDATGRIVVRADGQSNAAGVDPLGIYNEGPLPGVGNTIRYPLRKTATGLRLEVMKDMVAGGVTAGSYDPWVLGLDPNQAPTGVSSTEVTTIDTDKRGRVTSVQSPANRTMTFEYDDLGRMTKKLFPDGSSLETTYWRDGNVHVATHKDSSGQVFRALESSYDVDGRLASVDVTQTPAGYIGTTFQQFEWNGLNLLTLATDDKADPGLLDSTVACTYDSLGRRLTDTQNGRTVTLFFDDLYDTGFQFPGGRRIDRTRDDVGRLDEVLENSTGAMIADYGYFGRGNHIETLTLGNGAEKSLRAPLPGSGLANGYTASNRANYIEYSNASGLLDTVVALTHDSAGSRTVRARSIGASVTGWSIGYDSARRLALMQHQIDGSSTLTTGVVRDADGNTTLLGLEEGGQAATADTFVSAVDDWRYTSIAGKALDHDVAGNRTRDLWFEYAYDAFDRLVEVKDRYSTQVIARYSYDAFTRRIEKQSWVAPTERLLFEGRRLVEVRDTADNVVEQFVHGAGGDEVVQWTDASGTVRYFVTDDMGSIVGVLDDAGNVVERVEYDPYGAPIFQDAAGSNLVDTNGVPLAVSWVGNRFLFQGLEYDGELAEWRRAQATPSYFAQVPAAGQYNFRFRYAQPEEGRFISRDPFAMANNTSIDPSLLVGRILTGESSSPYELLQGAPQNRRDPLGLSTISIKPGSNSNVRGTSVDLPDGLGEKLGERYLDFLRNVAEEFGLPIETGDAVVSHVSCGDVEPPPSTGTKGGPTTGPPKGGGGPPETGGPKGGKGTGGLGAGVGVAIAAEAAGSAVVSVITVVSGEGESPVTEYLFTCTNPFGPAMTAYVGHLDGQIGGGPGLPQPSPPSVKEASSKLFREYLDARRRFEAEREKREQAGVRGAGADERNAWRRMIDAKQAGKAMSCTYFSRNSREGGEPGPVANLDCRDAWKEGATPTPETPGGGEDEGSLPNQGFGAKLELPERSALLASALEEFEHRGRVVERKNRTSVFPAAALAAVFGYVVRRP